MCLSVNPQDLKARNVIAERGQRATDWLQTIELERKRDDCRHDGRGRQQDAAFTDSQGPVGSGGVGDPGPPGSWYAATDSSFMQKELIYLSFLKSFKGFIVPNGLDDGEPRVRFLEGYASHLFIDIPKYARANETCLSIPAAVALFIHRYLASTCLRLGNFQAPACQSY